MRTISRRLFLQGSAALAAASAAGGMLSETTATAAPQQTRNGSANDTLHIAVIGVNGRGRNHIDGLAGRNNCIITHICDCDAQAGNRAVTHAERRQNRRPQFVQDLRRIMDDNSIHAVTIATPNHWHALAAIWAMQAGKHVYVEKPVSHNVWEGRRIVEIARQTGKICQAGTQIRSNPGVREAIEYIRSGQLGPVRLARGLCYKRRDNAQGTVSSVRPIPTPAELDFNLWLGPAQERPYHENLVHYRWHWYWDFGNGDLGNQGIHQMDVARWALGVNQLARGVVSAGGRFGVNDQAETANTQIAIFDYGQAQLVFEVRGLQSDRYRGAGVGNVIHCANGYVVFPNYTSAIAYDNDGNELRRFNRGNDQYHYDNFIDAVRNNSRERLNGDIEEGHLSSALCHLANISYRLGTPTPFNRRRDAFQDNEAASETFARMREHLETNQVPLENTNYMLGRRLRIDPETERFIEDEAANRMLTRDYRQGFQVPARS